MSVGVRADTQVLASFPVRSGLASDAASAPAASSPGLLDSFFYDDSVAIDTNTIPAAPEQFEER